MRDMSSQINSDADWNAVTSSFIIIFIVSSMYTNEEDRNRLILKIFNEGGKVFTNHAFKCRDTFTSSFDLQNVIV